MPLKMLHLYVLLSLMVFCWVQGLKFFLVAGPDWVFYYLNDFLTIPIVATLCLHGVWIIKKNRALRLDLFTVFTLVALFSFYFEYYLPQKSIRYTGDIMDVLCYSAGGIVFYVLQKLD